MIQFTFRDQFIQDYLCPCKTKDCNNDELNYPKSISDYYKSFEEKKSGIMDLIDLDDWNFAELAPKMGGKGKRVSTPREFETALKSAMQDESSFQLIEIMLPSDAMSDTLRRFTTTIAQRSALSGDTISSAA